MDTHFHFAIPGKYTISVDLSGVAALVSFGERIMSKLEELIEEVRQQGEVVDSAIVLLRELKAKLDEAGTDPDKLEELRAFLDSKQQELAQAIAENTPAK